MQALIIVYSIALVICLVLSFFFSSSDMVYGSVDLLRFDKEKIKKKGSYATAFKLANKYDNTISTILLCNDTVNAGIDSLATLIGMNLAYIVLKNNPNVANIAETWGLIASMIVLIFKIMFGEIIAKSIGKIYNFKLAKIYANIINFFYYLFYPITFLVSGFGKAVTYPITHNIQDIEIQEDDLHEMVNDIKKSGQVDEDSAEILHDAIKYTTTEAYEIMTPRVDMYAIDIDDPIEDIINDPKLYEYTRVPVYKDTIDNIIGYVKTKTLMFSKLSKEKINLNDILFTPLRFPRSTEINDILMAFKKEKEHFALIMDEYGGVEGLLTMEDILEEIVGDIWDEKDDPKEEYVKRSDGSYIIDGMMNIEDFFDLFDLNYEDIDTEYVTIGGFCIELLDDHFAKVGQVIKYQDLYMKVLALDKNKSISKLLVINNRKKEETIIDKIAKNLDKKDE